jgi:hypothetical protein
VTSATHGRRRPRRTDCSPGQHWTGHSDDAVDGGRGVRDPILGPTCRSVDQLFVHWSGSVDFRIDDAIMEDTGRAGCRLPVVPVADTVVRRN